MLLLIDNYDSFTYNLVHYFQELGVEIEVCRNDQLSPAEALRRKPRAIVLSPGPCTPNEAGICLPLIGEAARAHIPLLGVCLGHQAIGQHFGGRVVRGPVPVHGKTAHIFHKGTDLFKGLPSPFHATRYHSLIVAREDLPGDLRVSAETEDAIIMGLAHTSLPIYGVQFHPESIASQHGHALLRNFLEQAAS